MFDNVPEENTNSVSDKMKQGAEGSVSETNKTGKKIPTVNYIVAGLFVAGFIAACIYMARNLFKGK